MCGCGCLHRYGCGLAMGMYMHCTHNACVCPYRGPEIGMFASQNLQVNQVTVRRTGSVGH